MLNSIIKYQSSNFRFEIIEIINKTKDDLYFSKKELYWMDYFNSCKKEKGYNLRRDSSSGMTTHPLTSIKISNRLKEEWKTGIRDNHGLKLKKNWENNTIRKKNQSDLFRKSKTKYKYLLEKDNNIETCDYQRLIELKLNNCIATMCTKKKDSIMFKNYKITRIKLKI